MIGTIPLANAPPSRTRTVSVARIAKPLAIALSYSTWCFLATWIELGQRRSAYFAKYDLWTSVALPVICCELILTAALLAAYLLVLRSGMSRRARALLFLTAAIVPAGMASIAVLRELALNLPVHRAWFWPAAIACAAAAVAVSFRKPLPLARAVRDAFLYSWPVLAFILLQAFRFGIAHHPSEFQDRPLAARLAGNPPVRVVWVVFDALSRKIAFEQRPAGLYLPNFDRLRAESFYATAAAPPGDATLLCLPAMILGRRVTHSTPQGASDLELTTSRGRERFGATPDGNVFDDARALGYNTALAGWYHPYCRILNNSLTDCYWVKAWMGAGAEENVGGGSLLSAMSLHTRLQITGFPLMGRVPSVNPDRTMRQNMAERTGRLLAHAEDMIADPGIALTLIHIPVPHPPVWYNRKLSGMALDGRNSYVDAVALADEILGRLRARLQTAGLADRTAILVTSDHGWRWWMWRHGRDWTAEDERLPREDTLGVPFLLKLPDQNSPMVYSKSFSTTAIRHVIGELLHGRIRNNAAIAQAIAAAH